MFGYVNIDKPELKIKDYEIYRSVYCSLCKALGKNYSVFARFILNYDCTFLSLFVLSRSESCCGFKNGRCRFNPLKKCNYLKNGEDALNKGAALTIITSYYKLLDSIHDNPWYKKIIYFALKPLFSSWHKKALKNYPYYEEAVRDMYYSQLECEADENVCLDMAAEPTAKMLSAVLKAEGRDETEKSVLSQMGYHLGRWIYLMDAAADIAEDSKKDNFNPFLVKYKSPDNVVAEDVEGVISQSLFLLTKAYELIEINRFKEILDNIIYSGLSAKQKKVIYNGKDK